MVLQDKIWLVTLVGMGLVSLAFIYVITQAGKSADAAEATRVYNASNLLRRRLFWMLLVAFGVVSYATLYRFPIPSQHTPLNATQTVDAVGVQWAWQLSTNELQVGVPIEFRVTSADVNHGFAIYAPDGRIVTQTQVMPGYTNKLLVTFTTPGTYVIRCLEYCGLAHDVMASDLHVVANLEGGTP